MEEEDSTEDADPTSPSTVEDLPVELLLKLFHCLDSNTINTASLVSKKWHTVIDEMVGRKLFIGRQCQFVPQDQDRYLHQYVDISKISEIGVVECFVGEVTDPNQTQTLLTYLVTRLKKVIYGDQTTEFKAPYLLKSIHFDGPIPCQYFNSMMKTLPNLMHIELHMTSFCSLQTSSLENLGWKRLKSLRIWGHRLTDGIFTTFYPADKILPNILVLLSNYFPALSSYSIEYPFDIRDEKTLTQNIFIFLKRHPYLSKFKICVNISITDDGSEFETAADREWIREAKTTSKRLNLKSLEIIISSMRKVRLAKLWMAFVEQQKSLETVTILSFRIPPLMMSTICVNNWQTLKKLFISRILMSNSNNNGRNVQIDCNDLTRCVKLTNFTCEGMLSNFTEPGLISTRSLPKSIVHLEIGGLPLLHSDAHGLFFDLPELKNICLTDVGNLGRFGVAVETIRQTIALRRIMIVTIYRSVCVFVFFSPFGGIFSILLSSRQAFVNSKKGPYDYILGI
ncbi:hypothetical protein Ocin01_11826 [Orchesella cincta]|uniref:F-box domain-containing protein n=1 Tax=Orchesella cincta TaxID=48709 RepID=A0A1D2MPD7_ORCCI|nr:hypothetical protein Ocin01_11826 [Orchesella cincta]